LTLKRFPKRGERQSNCFRWAHGEETRPLFGGGKGRDGKNVEKKISKESLPKPIHISVGLN